MRFQQQKFTAIQAQRGLFRCEICEDWHSEKSAKSTKEMVFCEGCEDEVTKCTCGVQYHETTAAWDSMGDTYCSQECADNQDNLDEEDRAHVRQESISSIFI